MRTISTWTRLAALSALLCAAAAWAAEPESAPEGMVRIPSGRLAPMFRGPDDPEQIEVASFLLDVRPVTNADYLEFVRANPEWQRSKIKRIFADQDYLKLWAGDLEIGPALDARAPVTCVSWFAAKAYCRWKGGRLPTTTEWEYAASAGWTRPDGWNEPEFMSAVRAWHSSPALEKLPPAGSGRPNYFGARDLHGLVWEWVSDFNTVMVTGDARGDTGIERQLFCGGGAVNAKDRDNFPAFMRYGFRSSLKAGYTVRNLGFRCARSLTSKSP